ncbi:MAG: hypothetical protein HY718_04660, partial [Planctomycetes bacterium]|nr:hypothetical protein [Planctomycetota bacterium]
MRVLSYSAIVALVVGVVAGLALADDLNPPPWRGAPGSTWQVWQFGDPSPNPPPDAGNNPYGVPSSTIAPGIGQAWLPTWDGRTGVWPLSGEIIIEIPNRPLPLPFKDIWIQLTWQPQVPN